MSYNDFTNRIMQLGLADITKTQFLRQFYEAQIRLDHAKIVALTVALGRLEEREAKSC